MSVNGLKTLPITNKLPKYGYPINEHMITLDDGRLMAAMRIKGIPFECESTASINAAFNKIRNFLNQLATRQGSNLAVWTHIIKREEKLDVSYSFDNAFVQNFSDRYLKTFEGQRFFSTDYYLTFVYRYKGELSAGERELYDLLNIGLAVLGEFSASLIGLTQENNSIRAENIEFLSFLMNHNDRTIPLTQNKVVEVVGDSDWHFGYDLLEIRNTHSTTSQYASFFELDGYPMTTHCGMWDFILAIPCEFVLTQSMIFMKPPEAVKRIKTQLNLIKSSDHTENEVNELETGRDEASIGNISFGDYHCSLAVFSKNQEGAIKDGTDLYSAFLGRNVSFKRSNLKSQFSFLSMMPGSKDRMLPIPRTVTNLACGWSLHNYSQGKKEENPIGDGSAIMPLKTVSDNVYYFNSHASKLGINAIGEPMAGHLLVLGASGTGKTTLQATLTAYFSRFNPQIFALDYKRSTELVMRILGAQYFTFEEGIDTGLNPFQLPDTPQLRSFLLRLTLRIAADHNGLCTNAEEKELKEAIDNMMDLDGEPQHRGLSRLLQLVQEPELRARLSKWCRSENGQFAWCLDSPVMRFEPDTMDKIGFDTTLLIGDISAGKADKPYCEPIFGVLFFLKALMQKEGRVLMSIVEEFWMPANYPLTQALMKDVLKSGRFNYEFMVLCSQSPEDAISSEIFPAIIQQTATKIYLPNPEAEFESYKRCNMTMAEFTKLQALAKDSRTFLIKQSNSSAFAKMELNGFEELPIISPSKRGLALCDQLRAEHGDDPAVWLPLFTQAIKNFAKE